MYRIIIAIVAICVSTFAWSTTWQDGMSPNKYELAQLLESRQETPNYESLWEYHPNHNTHQNEFDRREKKQAFLASIDSELQKSKSVRYLEMTTVVQLDEYDYERKGFPIKRRIDGLGYGKYTVDIVNAEWVNFIYVGDKALAFLKDKLRRIGPSRNVNLKLSLVIADQTNPSERKNRVSVNSKVYQLEAEHAISKQVIARYQIPEEEK